MKNIHYMHWLWVERLSETTRKEVQINKCIDMYEAQKRMLEYGINFNQLI